MCNPVLVALPGEMGGATSVGPPSPSAEDEEQWGGRLREVCGPGRLREKSQFSRGYWLMGSQALNPLEQSTK